MIENKFKGKIITASSKDVFLPSGLKTKIDLVEHPGGACILAIDNDDKIILLKQYRATIEKYIWEIPAGKIDNKEEPLICAKRELEEEAGFKANCWEKMIEIFSTPGFCDEVLHIYKATDLVESKTNQEEHEVIEVYKFSMSEIKKMIHNKEIQDAKTLIALLLWVESTSL